jgi:signal transduction histidine kinase
MERIRNTIAESRARTDASLGAERAGMDEAADRLAARAQRALDDLIEHDRSVADERLAKFRESADRRLAQERKASPARNSSTAVERQLADEDKKVERAATDSLLEGERLLADAVAGTERGNHQADLAGRQERRDDTDEHLSTERSGADGTLGETQDALARAQRERARRHDVLAMVTHDLRNPLTIIAMNAQTIAQVTEGATRESAQEVTRTVARMGRLLTDLLDVARIESGTLRIFQRPHDVRALVTEVLQSYGPLFADRGIAFTVEPPVSAAVATFDHDRIVQVLSNLLGNAMKFTPRNGSVALHVEQRGEEFEFALRDSGPGIRPDALPHVFERFWQIENEARRGLGLGLYICENIVVAHHGRIWVESDFGKGATFHFTLPKN